ncbi:hypothetical protein, partial [Pseudomonas viridiflava]|uniref:hypothetical protein n=1 Tax=Pseudomonas viridiflava TaxID=33069 RepID=UPI0019D17308
MPAMNDDAISLTYRVGCIAGKPPLIKQPIPTKGMRFFVGARLPAIASCQSLIFCLYEPTVGLPPRP